MDTSFDYHSPLREIVPGRFMRVSVQTPTDGIGDAQFIVLYVSSIDAAIAPANASSP
jgi:hypothetical protein